MPSPLTRDLFISYARRDNQDGWVDAFVKAVQEEHARFSPQPLRVFFDREDIAAMDDWEHRILEGLRSSAVMLAFLSPAYFTSAYCRKEWEIYLEHELDRALSGQGVAPIYTVTVPGLEDEIAAALDDWTANLRRRQYLDVRPWRPRGPEALQLADVRRRLELLGQRLLVQLQAASRAATSPTTVPPHNPHFVGRLEELRRLREAVALGRVGAVTAVHGLGGIGKSALAFEYAHAYAAEYPGGRYLLACGGVKDLRVPLVALAEHRGVELAPPERADLDTAFARVRAVFEQGERSLILLDDVEDPALLAPGRRALHLPRGDRVHVLVTTRLPPERLPGLECIAVDALSEAESLRLLEEHRPIEGTHEAEAAARIARRLGGYALAVEVVAVYLWQTPEVSYAGYAARLEREGLKALEGAAREEGVELTRHSQKLVTELLAPTLGRLSAPAARALELAAVLPPDRVALPWLRARVGADFPEAAAEPEPGYPDPWRQIERHLFGLRLLTPGDSPAVARIHRLVAAVVRERLSPERVAELRRLLATHAGERGNWLTEHWHEPAARWELEPLQDFAHLLLEAGEEAGVPVACRAGECLLPLARVQEIRTLMGAAVAFLEAAGRADGDLGSCLDVLGHAEAEAGRFETALTLHRRSLDIAETTLPPDDPTLADRCNNLASIEYSLGNMEGARSLLTRAFRIYEQRPDTDVGSLATLANNLGAMEHNLGHLREARKRLRHAVALSEEALPPDHPRLGWRLSNLALVERDCGEYSAARDLSARTVALAREGLGGDHPHTAWALCQLAGIERDLGHFQEAGRLLEEATRIQKGAVDPGHPDLAMARAIRGMVERDTGRPEVARELLEQAVLAEERLFPGTHPILLRHRFSLAQAEADLGRLEEARALLQRVAEGWIETRGERYYVLGAVYTELGRVERERGDLDTARALLLRAIALHQEHFDPLHPRLAETRFQLAQAELTGGSAGMALDLARQAHRALLARLGPDHPETQRVASWLASRGSPRHRLDKFPRICVHLVSSVSICVPSGTAAGGICAVGDEPLRMRISDRAASFQESVIREMTRLHAIHGGVNLAQGYPDFDPPAEIIEAACRALREGYNQYAITWGAPRLRQAIARRAEEFNRIPTDPDRSVTVCCGATEAMISTLMAVCNPGDEVIVFTPFYENYGPDAILSNSRPVYVPLYPPLLKAEGGRRKAEGSETPSAQGPTPNAGSLPPSEGWSYDPAELAAAFTGRTRAIIINTPHNPTGHVFTRAELEGIAELCRRHDCLAITDEIYEHILYDGREHVSIASLDGMRDRTVTISGASKTFSVTGWRLGWAIAPEDISTGIRRVHDFLTVGAPHPLQMAAVAALELPESYYQGLVQAYTRRRDRTVAMIRATGLRPYAPEGAYYTLADIRALPFEDDLQLTMHLVREIGVAVVPGSSFYPAGAEAGKRLIRFAFPKRDETLAEAERRLASLRPAGGAGE